MLIGIIFFIAGVILYKLITSMPSVVRIPYALKPLLEEAPALFGFAVFIALIINMGQLFAYSFKHSSNHMIMALEIIILLSMIIYTYSSVAHNNIKPSASRHFA